MVMARSFTKTGHPVQITTSTLKTKGFLVLQICPDFKSRVTSDSTIATVSFYTKLWFPMSFHCVIDKPYFWNPILFQNEKLIRIKVEFCK